MNLGSLLGGLGQLAVPLLQGYTGGQVQGNELRLQLAQQQQQRQQAERLRQMQIALQRAQMEQDQRQFEATQAARSQQSALEALQAMQRPFYDPETLATAERSGQLEAMRGDAEGLARMAGVPTPNFFQPRLPDAAVPHIAGMVGAFPQIRGETVPQYRFQEPASAIAEREKTQAQTAAARALVPQREAQAAYTGARAQFAPELFGSQIERNIAGAEASRAQAAATTGRLSLDTKKFTEGVRRWDKEFAAGRADAAKRFGFQERMTKVAEAAQQINETLANLRGELFKSQTDQIKQQVARIAKIDPVFEQVLKNWDDLFDTNPYSGASIPNQQKIGQLSDFLTMAGSTAGEYLRQIGQNIPANPMIPNSQPGIPSMFPPSETPPPPIYPGPGQVNPASSYPPPGAFGAPPPGFPNFGRIPTQGTQTAPVRQATPRAQAKPQAKPRTPQQEETEARTKAFQRARKVEKNQELVQEVWDDFWNGRSSTTMRSLSGSALTRYRKVWQAITGVKNAKDL